MVFLGNANDIIPVADNFHVSDVLSAFTVVVVDHADYMIVGIHAGLELTQHKHPGISCADQHRPAL